MSSKQVSSKLRVQASGGETRDLMVFSEPRLCDAPPDRAERLRWARDEEGRWYSFSSYDDSSVVESRSGDWFAILA